MTPKFREIKPNKVTGKLYEECEDDNCKPDENGMTKLATWREVIEQINPYIHKRVYCYCTECKEKRENEKTKTKNT